MEKLKFNPDNKKYYSEEFIKGFECGVERQFNADKAEPKTAEWIETFTGNGQLRYKCSDCNATGYLYKREICPNCGAKMKGESE